MARHCLRCVEEPGYATARRVFSIGGLDVVPVPIDHEGFNVERAKAKAADARAAFVTPARQYPTGVTMPLSRRMELLNWAASEKAIVIEDDYDSEYRYVGKPLPALMSLDRASSVIYSGTFSKVFSPIIRLGFIVVPPRMIEVMQRERVSFGAPPSLLVQPALAQFMQHGQFAQHIRRMRRLYAGRRAALLQALAKHDGKLYTLDAPPSGLTIMLRLTDKHDDVVMTEALNKIGTEVQSLSSHFTGRSRQQGLLLSFAGFAERELLQSAEKLMQALASMHPVQ
jgi:GntR family transcriptional regulator / MocR family aminotransferase